MQNCRFYKSVSKIENIQECDLLCGPLCKVIKQYKKLLDDGKIDLIDDIANFRHQNNEKGSVNNEQNNKRNFKRTISKSRKKYKIKSK